MGKSYAKTKIFHFPDKLTSFKESKISSPIHVRIKPTNSCNHNCSYCSYRAECLQLGKDMVIKDFIPKNKLIEIIDDLDSMKVKAVTFSGGGEPFCYPYLLDVLKKISKTNIKFRSYTNGARLEGEVSELFAQKGTWLRVSMDGWDNKSYSEYRRVKDGEYTKIMNNMENFKKFGGPCSLGVSLIIGEKNSSHVYEMIQRLKNVGVSSIKVSPCIVSDYGEQNNLYHEPFFNQVKEQIKKAVLDFEKNDFEIFDSYNKEVISFKKDYAWCPYIQIRPVIGADQNIYACQDKAYNLDNGLIGSIKNQSFKKFWFSDRDNFFKINPALNCDHHCVADTENKLIIDYLNVDRKELEFV
ncbi:MAG: radical SAM protein [Candidatus Nanoarchaeia archaeon]|nr:radical SAM protein [Candidatus Nanoarchaeia archaeon]MDD5589312.1 radical SAM protein [Candidatus Nanoarchaeia archaeon]